MTTHDEAYLDLTIPGVRPIHVGPLPRAAVEQIVLRYKSHDPLVAACKMAFRAIAGNPSITPEAQAALKLIRKGLKLAKGGE
jgi:hypothetical protein